MTMHTLRRSGATLVALLLTAAALAGCGDDSATATTTTAPGTETPTEATTGGETAEQLVVVASTSWVAAFAVAAGVEDVTIVAPADLQHPPDYDPRPSDLAAVAEADYVLLAGFEGFAERLVEATGSGAELIEVEAENTAANIRRQVLALGEVFGTTDAAETWIEAFDERVAELQAELEAARPDPAPSAVAHVFMAYWTEFAGVDLVGTYGPTPVTADQLAEFTAEAPQLLFANAHVPAGPAFADLDAVQVDIVNFPGDSFDLLEVFEQNTESILAAFAEL